MPELLKATIDSDFFGYNNSKIVTSGRLEHFYLAIVVVEPLQLDLGAGAEIDEKRSRITGTAKVAERLVMLLLRKLGQSLALDDDIADGCLHDKVHLEEGLKRLALVHRVVFEFLMGGQSGAVQLVEERFLVDILRESGAQGFVHLEDSSDDGVTRVDEFRLAGFRDHMDGGFVHCFF